jgi:hypothetical protein
MRSPCSSVEPAPGAGRDARRGLLVLWIATLSWMAAVALLMRRLGLPGWDDAAHAYKLFLLRQGQGTLWDNHWYGGAYGAVTYGFLFYRLALVLPAKVIAVVAGSFVPPAFHVYQRDLWKIEDPWPSWILAGVMGAYLAHGQDPFVLALGLTLGGLGLLAVGRPVAGALLVGLGIFANPMGLVVGGVFIVADVLARPEARRRYLAFLPVLAPFVAARLLVGRAFREPAAYLNETDQLFIQLGFALGGVLLAGACAIRPRRPLVVLFLAHAAICLLSFSIPGSPLGNNAGRFFFVFGLPLLVLLRPRRAAPWPAKALALAAVAVFAVLQLRDPWEHLADAEDRPQTQARFFAPALAAAAQLHDSDHRIHVVALRRHWEAFYLPAAGYPITRGWYRQADSIHDHLFYTDYDAAAYTSWLRRMGAEYVFLADARPDEWSEREETLLRHSPAFSLVRRTGAWAVYRLRHAEPLVVGLDGGRAHVVSFQHLRIDLSVDRPGAFLVKVTFSPYWQADEAASLVRGPDDFMVLRASRAGPQSVRFQVTGAKVLAALRAP